MYSVFVLTIVPKRETASGVFNDKILAQLEFLNVSTITVVLNYKTQ